MSAFSTRISYRNKSRIKVWCVCVCERDLATKHDNTMTTLEQFLPDFLSLRLRHRGLQKLKNKNLECPCLQQR